MNDFISQKFKFYSFISMLLLVFVHGYNLANSYLQPFTVVQEPLTITTFTEYLLANGIFRFRIPMLFIISGYLFAAHDAKPYALRMKKRLRTLGIPYLFWSAFALLLTFLWQQFPVTAQAVSQAQLDQMGDNRPYTEMGITDIIADIFGSIMTPFEPKEREKYSWEIEEEMSIQSLSHTLSTEVHSMENNTLSEIEEVTIGISSLAEILTQNNAILRNMMGNQFRIIQRLEEMADDDLAKFANDNYENIRALMQENVNAFNQLVNGKIAAKLQQKAQQA